jgi:hypothetical protein
MLSETHNTYHNDIQLNDSQYNEIQHNKMPRSARQYSKLCCNAECHLD